MAEGIDATSFDFYEGIRIFTPGALMLGVVELSARTLGEGSAGLGLSAVEAVAVSLLIGLLFYYADVPAKSAIFFPEQPTDTLKAWGMRPKHGGHLNTYFVMLDTAVPAPIRARALYMGSMFRIGMETIFILALSGVILVSSQAWSFEVVDASVSPQDRPSLATAAAVVLIWAFAQWRDRQPRRTEFAARRRRAREVVEFYWLDLLFLVPPTVWIGVVLCGWREPRAWLLLLGVGWATGLWAMRYFRGYPARQSGASNSVKPRRRPINAAHACLLLGYANLCALATTSALPAHPLGLTSRERNLWLVVMVLGMVLVCSRGHEKRLRGAYATQNTWLELNRAALEEQFYSGPEPIRSERASRVGLAIALWHVVRARRRI